jgi:hypothetical protein
MSRFTFLRKIFLCSSYALQCRRKWSTVSLYRPQAGHIAVSLIPMRSRCEFSPTCPVLSCVQMLPAIRLAFAKTRRWLSGELSLMTPCERLDCGARDQTSLVAALTAVLNSCFTADLLRGSAFLRNPGICFDTLTCPSAASLDVGRLTMLEMSSCQVRRGTAREFAYEAGNCEFLEVAVSLDFLDNHLEYYNPF